MYYFRLFISLNFYNIIVLVLRKYKKIFGNFKKHIKRNWDVEITEFVYIEGEYEVSYTMTPPHLQWEIRFEFQRGPGRVNWYGTFLYNAIWKIFSSVSSESWGWSSDSLLCAVLLHSDFIFWKSLDSSE